MRKALLLLSFLFATIAGYTQVTVLSESFDGTTFPPTGWTRTTSATNTFNGNVHWLRTVSAGSSSPTPATHTGLGMAYLNTYWISNGGSAELMTPALNFSSAGTYSVSFWTYNTYSGFYHDSLKVYINTSATSVGGTLLAVLEPTYNSGTGWFQYTYSIPTTYTGTSNYIVFRGVSNYGYDIFLDDVTVLNYPPVPCTGTPLQPTVSSTTTSSTSAPICAGTSVTLKAVDPNLPTTANITYQWQSSTTSATAGFSNVTTGSGANTLTYTTNPPTTTWYRIGATCSNSNIITYSAAFVIYTGGPQPGPISGRPSSCPNDTATYAVPLVAGTTYNWALPTGWTGTSTTNSILVTMGTNPGTITVTANSACGVSPARTLTVLAGSAPATPVAINGFNSVCSYTTQTYSVAPVAAATSYIWTLPNGWTGTSTGPSITVATDTTSGTVSVKAKNGCGLSTAASLAVNVINSLANPGVITSSAPGGVYCSGALYSFSINPVPGATSYQWVLPTGWSGTTTGTSVQTFAGSASGQIKVTAYVSCATSPTSSLNTPVTPAVNPGVSITAPPALCQGVPATFTASAANGGTNPVYQWRKNGVNVFSVGNTYTDAALVTGDVISVRLTSTATCRTIDTINSSAITANITPSVTPGISINSTPVVTICAGTTLNFTSTIAGGGSAPLYQWYINTLPVATSTTYSTSGLANGDTVSVKLTSNATCATVNTVSSNKVGIKVNPLVAPSITANASSNIADGSSVTFTAAQSGGGPKQDYQWLRNGVEIPNATGSTYTSDKLVPGDRISVRMVSYDPCANPGVITSADVVMYGAVHVGSLSAWQGTLSLYPNPTSGRLTVAAAWAGNHSATERVTIDVLNAVGQNVYHSEVAPGNAVKGEWHYEVSLPETTPAGQYILRLNAPESGMRAALPLILNR